MTTFVSALFDTSARAELAITELARVGFGPNQVRVIANPTPGDTGSTVLEREAAERPQAPDPSLAEGATLASGATGGMVLGAIGGTVATGAVLAVPALAAAASVPLAAALAGTAAGGVAGGMLGAYFGNGPTSAEPPVLRDDRLREGGFVVGVDAEEEVRELALDALHSAGGESFRLT